MHRAQPVPSKILERKYQDKLLESHHQRLKVIKPTFQIQEPKQYRYIADKPKRAQQLEGTNTPP